MRIKLPKFLYFVSLIFLVLDAKEVSDFFLACLILNE